MKNKRLRQIKAEIARIKLELQKIGDMRPGLLTVQYRDPEKRTGPFHQISYTHKMKSRTEYVRPMFVEKIKLELSAYRRFKKLVKGWVDLALEQSKLEVDIAKKEISK